VSKTLRVFIHARSIVFETRTRPRTRRVQERRGLLFTVSVIASTHVRVRFGVGYANRGALSENNGETVSAIAS
jgi:hypothetical protein